MREDLVGAVALAIFVAGCSAAGSGTRITRPTADRPPSAAPAPAGAGGAADRQPEQAFLARVASRGDDILIREKAVQKLTDQRLLADVALANNSEYPDTLVGEAAVARLTDQALLAEVAVSYRGKYPPGRVGEAAFARLEDQGLLIGLAEGPYAERIRRFATSKVTDQSLLARLALGDASGWVRNAAASRVEDTAVLLRVATEDAEPFVRAAAVERISDSAVLSRWAVGDPSDQVRLAAVKRLSDPSVLATVALRDKDCSIQEVAAGRLDDQPSLATVALQARCFDTRYKAVSRLTDTASLGRVAAESDEERISLPAMDRVECDDAALLARIVSTQRSKTVQRLAAFRLVTLSEDPAVLLRYAGDLSRTTQDAVAGTARFKLLLREAELASRFAGLRLLGRIRRTTQLYWNAGDASGESVTIFLEGADRGLVLPPLTFETVFEGHVFGLAFQPAKFHWTPTFEKLVEGLVLSDAEWERLARSKFAEARVLAARHLESQEAIARMALGDASAEARSVAVAHLRDASVLARVALDDAEAYIRSKAVSRLSDPEMLAKVARKARDRDILEEAVNRLSDPAILRALANDKEASDLLREAARKRLKLKGD
jgi:hypothetical protein